MNFMKNNDPFPKKRKRQTINFFQTVREGKRTFTTAQKREEENCSQTPWVYGRKFIQATRKVAGSCRSGTDVKTILSTIEQRSDPGSSAAEEKLEKLFSFSSLSESTSKKKKSSSNYDSWTFINRCNEGETSGSSQVVYTFSSCQQIPTYNLPASFNKTKNEINPPVENLAGSAQGSREYCQPPSISDCRTCNDEQFLCTSTEQSTSVQGSNKKKPFFDIDNSMSSNAFREESFFKVTTGNTKSDTFEEGFFDIPTESNSQPPMPLPKDEFFKMSRLHHRNQTSSSEVVVTQPRKLNSNRSFFMKPHLSISNKGFLKTPSNPQQCPSSKERFFNRTTMEPVQSNTDQAFSKNPPTQLEKPISHGGFLNMQPPKTTSNDGFFKRPVVQPREIASNEGFFKAPAEPSQQRISNEGLFNVSITHRDKPTSNEGFFKMQHRKSTSNEGFFKTPVMHPWKATSNKAFFNTPIDPSPKRKSNEGLLNVSIIQPQKTTSNEVFFHMQHIRSTLNEDSFKTPAMQRQQLSLNEGFLKTPAMSPGKRGSNKELLNISTMQQDKPSSNDRFFKIPTIQSEKAGANEGFFNLQPQNSISNQGFFSQIPNVKHQNLTSDSCFISTPAIQTHKSTLNDCFLKTPTMESETSRKEKNFKKPLKQPQKIRLNEWLFKTPTIVPQKSPSYDEFLRPHLNPQVFGSNKGLEKIAESDPSGSDKYDSLFATPSRVTSLPKMITPHLFQPFEKPPSKTSATPASKNASRTTSKTPNVSNEDSTYYIMSVTEGRGCSVCEVGYAAIDLKHPELILCQFSDVPTYKKLLTKINLLDIAEILMPETFTNTNPSEMYKKVTEFFPDVWLTTAKRVQFSAKNGLDSIRRLMLPDDSSIEVIIYKKYYALAATEALFRYIEVKHSILFSPKTLKISFESAKDIVAMDFETCQRLELVTSSASVLFPEKYSLFGVLNCTKTMGGKRRLRTSLMQPLCSQEQLEARLSSVNALVCSQQTLTSLQTCLLKFTSVERLLWLCRRTPNFRNESNTFDILTNYILLLKGCLESVPHLRKVLEEIDDDHIINIRDDLYNEDYELMLIHIKKMIREDARLGKGYAASSRERCFAISEGVNDLLDLARATYSQLVELIFKMVTELGEEYNMPLKMTQTADMGFHASYVLPKRMLFKKEDVPNIFTEVKIKNRTVHLLTDDLFNLNIRINRAMEEIQLITNVVIYDLVESLKEGMTCLYRLCDHVADLDLLSSLAQISSTPDYVRPVFGSHTCLIGARHPIMDHLCPSKPIPNNIIASTGSNFTIVTGPNMSGKTVYVLTVPLIQVMAQVGCYVPADKAELRITDHIYLRKGGMDNMQCRLSSHGVEMKELSYTLKILTSRSLIILDELCTNCTCTWGICLAWAFCEEFLKESAFTFLTTHYHYLCNLSKVYRNVKNFHMEAIERTPAPGDISCDLTFTFRLLPGITQMTNYALRLMMGSALPDEVKKYALAVAEDMKRRREASLPVCVVDDPVTTKEMVRIEKLENFMFNLKALCKTDKLTPKMIRTLQKMIHEEILPDLENDDKINDEKSKESFDVNKEYVTVTEEVQQTEEPLNDILKEIELIENTEYQLIKENEYSELYVRQLLKEKQPVDNDEEEQPVEKDIEEEQPVDIDSDEGDKDFQNNNIKYTKNKKIENFPEPYGIPLNHDIEQLRFDEDSDTDDCISKNVRVLDSEKFIDLNDTTLFQNKEQTIVDKKQEFKDNDVKYPVPKEVKMLTELSDFNMKEKYRHFLIGNQSQSNDEDYENSEECEGTESSTYTQSADYGSPVKEAQ